MHRRLFVLVALFSAAVLSGCSSANEPAPASSTASPAASDTKPALADSTTPKDVPAAADNQVVNHPLTKAIVMPPKPKPGAPHGPGFDMPLIDIGGFAPPRPMDVLRDAHIFTADHPEVASFVPCYCGCGQAGHKDNADCFIRHRDPEGRVTEWEPHGSACAVCIDIAVQSMRMRNSGASVSAIRQQVQNDYRPRFGTATETPTPPPPAGK